MQKHINDELMAAANKVVTQLRNDSEGAAEALAALVNHGRQSPGSIARRAVNYIMAEAKPASWSVPGYAPKPDAESAGLAAFLNLANERETAKKAEPTTGYKVEVEIESLAAKQGGTATWTGTTAPTSQPDAPPTVAESLQELIGLKPQEPKTCIHPWATMNHAMFGALVCGLCDRILVQPKIPEPPSPEETMSRLVAEVRAEGIKNGWSPGHSALAERVAKILLG